MPCPHVPPPAGTRPTLSLVAKAAGTSVPTVSKVLRGGTDVSAETRAKVMEAVRAVGYTRRTGAKSEGARDEAGSSDVLDLVLTNWWKGNVTPPHPRRQLGHRARRPAGPYRRSPGRTRPTAPLRSPPRAPMVTLVAPRVTDARVGDAPAAAAVARRSTFPSGHRTSQEESPWATSPRESGLR
ncbi:LacI family DNA-binding transcriptional regulator [Streptomyces sp. MS06]|uniref:LacI family DNA-binding transcriptional regulator n=1 Tax=Streptomyces sp. MS06 TaxID=3385974 RepID=UPI0039A3644A